MGYIKFVLKRTSDTEGKTLETKVSRMETDMRHGENYWTNLIMHALSGKGLVEQIRDFILDNSRLDTDILG